MKVPHARIEKFVVPEKDEGITPMKHIWFDCENERLLATDGHMAVRETAIVEDGDVTGLIPVEAFDLARKELKNISKATKEDMPDPWLKVACGPDAVVITNLLTNTTHLVTRPKLESDRKFPNVDAVFAQLKAKPSVTLNGEYVSRIVGALGTEGISMSMWVPAPDQPVTIASPDGKSVAVLMPMRGEPNVDEINRRGAPLGQAQTSEGRDPQSPSPEATEA
jgi:hypothetical protein